MAYFGGNSTSKIEHGLTSTGGWTAFTNVVDIQSPEPEQELHAAPFLGCGVKPYLTGYTEGGTFTFMTNYDKTQLGVLNGLRGLTTTWIKVTFPDGGTAVCNVIVQKNGSKIDDNVETVETTCKLISDVTLA